MNSTQKIDDGKAQYPLQRTYIASSRLNLQHYQMHQLIGSLIPPHIPIAPKDLIADLGAGTGIWLLDLSRSVPNDCTLEGWDISDQQFPLPGGLPQNVKFGLLDCSQENGVPENLKQRYSVVHIGIVGAVIKNEDVLNIWIRNVWEMLKPGGFFVWLEGNFFDLLLDIEFSPIDQAKYPAMHELQQMHKEQLSKLGGAFAWVKELDKHFRSHGFQDVQKNEYKVDSRFSRSWTETALLVLQELAVTMGDTEKEKLVPRASAEMQKGALNPNVAPLLVVGRKPKREDLKTLL